MSVRDAGVQRFGLRYFASLSTGTSRAPQGCATIGEVWRFLRFTGDTLWLDNDRYYLADLPRLMGALLAVVKRYEGSPKRTACEQ